MLLFQNEVNLHFRGKIIPRLFGVGMTKNKRLDIQPKYFFKTLSFYDDAENSNTSFGCKILARGCKKKALHEIVQCKSDGNDISCLDFTK